jgi:hypothetical protein
MSVVGRWVFDCFKKEILYIGRINPHNNSFFSGRKFLCRGNNRQPMLKLNKTYFCLFLLIFFTEVLIAMYVHDSLVRPYFGDLLVVILIYCFIKSFLNTKVFPTAIFVLLFAFAVEALQYLDIVETFQIKNRILRTVLGTSFEWNDILAYISGILIVLLVEKARLNNPIKTENR